MICMLTPSTFLGSDPAPRVSPEKEVSSPASSPPSEDEADSSDMTNEVPETTQGEVVNVQLPPTPPIAGGDCDSFSEAEKSLESPLKGYRRVLVKHENRWTLQFVSPEGIRFDSQDELASHVCRERSDIDPNDLKKLDLHFLKEVDEKENQIAKGDDLRDHDENDEAFSTQTVPFTFCSMRQNIFDLKRKRGCKRTHSKEFRRNSIAAISLDTETNPKKLLLDVVEEEDSEPPEFQIKQEANELPESRLKEEVITEAPDKEELKSETNLHSEPEEKKTNLPESPVQLSCAKKEPEPVNQAASATVQRSESCDDKLLSNSIEPKQEKEDEAKSSQDKSPRGDVLPITLNENEEIQIVSGTEPDEEDEPLEMKMDDCKVSLVDIFEKTPLSSFQCLGCNSNYCGLRDKFTVNLQCQTLSVVCGSCLWWTSRRISSVYIEKSNPFIPENK